MVIFLAERSVQGSDHPELSPTLQNRSPTSQLTIKPINWRGCQIPLQRLVRPIFILWIAPSERVLEILETPLRNLYITYLTS